MKLLSRSVYTKGKALVVGFGILTMSVYSYAFTSSDIEKTHRAKDLLYGNTLYEYYQGNTFEALSLLQVAKTKGGIKGHNDHPELVEGGLLLSYGMTLEAKEIFENVLTQKLSISDRNLAWFFLGKVFYLEQNYSESLDSFDKINLSALKEDSPSKFYELIYLKTQISALFSGELGHNTGVNNGSHSLIKLLPHHHVYRYYIQYNQAVKRLNESDIDESITLFRTLINELAIQKNKSKWRADQANQVNIGLVGLDLELNALYNQSLLSLGQIYLQKENNDLAFEVLKLVDKDSAFSDNALFLYAISASNLKHYDIALSALKSLNERSLFNPWQQQTPYALAYLYEQLNEPELALEAYRAAVSTYENLQNDLAIERQNLSEKMLLKALNLTGLLGTDTLEKDAYGRVHLERNHFGFSKLLTTEVFQRQLSELHELYLLKNSLYRWEGQLDSFEDMLETRLLSRQKKLQSIKENLTSKEVLLWDQKVKAFEKNIENALATGDAYFFMTDEQIEYFQRLSKTQERLQLLPDEHKKKAEYTLRLQRAKAYFDWWVRDEYSVNSWRALKELKALLSQMVIFHERYRLLNAEQELDDAHLKFTERVTSGRERLNSLKDVLHSSLAQSSKHLIELVDSEMQHQLTEIGKYLLASREALARVSDSLLADGKIRYINSDTSNSIDEKNELIEIEGRE